jgi:hypothetical protein
MYVHLIETVTDLIEDKIKNETNLPDYLALLAKLQGQKTLLCLSFHKDN